MTDAYRNRWLVVFVVWVAAVLLGYWNLQVIERIAVGRQTWQIIEANQVFLDGRKPDMEKVAGQLEKMAIPVASPVFARLSAEEHLVKLATKYGLKEFKVAGEAGKTARNINSLPLTVSFKGKLSAATLWLTVVQTDFPYLVIRRMEAKGGAADPLASFTLQLNCRFRSVSS